MNAAVIYFSKFGNTRQVAAAIAETISGASPGAAQTSPKVHLVNAVQLSATDLKDADLVIVGCPTHRMNLPEALRPILEGLPRRVLKGKAVAAFDTSYKMSGWLAHFTAAHRLASKLHRLGGKLVVGPQTFHVIERQGPLYDTEIARAREWATHILGKID